MPGKREAKQPDEPPKEATRASSRLAKLAPAPQPTTSTGRGHNTTVQANGKPMRRTIADKEQEAAVYVETQTKAQRDAAARGEQAKKSRNAAAKLTSEKVTVDAPGTQASDVLAAIPDANLTPDAAQFTFEYVFDGFLSFGLIRLHQNQSHYSNRRLTAWLIGARQIVTHVFNRIAPGPEEAGNAWPTEEERDDFIHYLPEVVETLQLDTDENTSLFPTPEKAALPVLITDKKICIFGCLDVNGSPQHLQRDRDINEATLINRAYIKLSAILVIAHCNRCQADYYPDRVVKKHRGVNRQFYLYDARFIRISKPVTLWVDRTLAAAQAQSILQHQTFSGYQNHFNKTYGPFGCAKSYDGLSDDLRPTITDEQSYRMFVEHMVRLLGAAQPNRPVFHTLQNPDEEVLVKAANEWFQVRDGVLPNAREHTCDDCTHDKRYREGNGNAVMPAQVRNAAFGVVGVDDEPPELPERHNEAIDEELGDEQGPRPRPQNIARPQGVNEARVVRMAVLDGLVAGHSLCNAPLAEPCRNPPQDFKSARFCEAHRNFAFQCGLVGCERPVTPGSKVCNSPDHLRFYDQWRKRYGRVSMHSVTRTLERREDVRQNNQAQGPRAELPPLPALPALPAGDAAAPPEGQNIKHTFQAARTYCVQLLTWACGHPIAFAKFYVSESESQVFSFVNRVWPDQMNARRPDYLVYDRACFLLRHIVTSHRNSLWIKRVRFIVDAWHYIGHRLEDELCRTRCNPAPTDGSQPDLIIVERDDNGRELTRRAFNTEVAEQLNSWFKGYKGSLNRMTDTNFDFFIFCLLFLFAQDWSYRRADAVRQGIRGEARNAERLARRQAAEAEAANILAMDVD